MRCFGLISIWCLCPVVSFQREKERKVKIKWNKDFSVRKKNSATCHVEHQMKTERYDSPLLQTRSRYTYWCCFNCSYCYCCCCCRCTCCVLCCVVLCCVYVLRLNSVPMNCLWYGIRAYSLLPSLFDSFSLARVFLCVCVWVERCARHPVWISYTWSLYVYVLAVMRTIIFTSCRSIIRWYLTIVYIVSIQSATRRFSHSRAQPVGEAHTHTDSFYTTFNILTHQICTFTWRHTVEWHMQLHDKYTNTLCRHTHTHTAEPLLYWTMLQ